MVTSADTGAVLRQPELYLIWKKAMSQSFESVLNKLKSFSPVGPFGEDNAFALYDAVPGLEQLPREQKLALIPAALELMERSPHIEMGTPGPLVHMIESLGVLAYESFLVASVRRSPGPTNVWMVNRILNSQLPEDRRAVLMQLLRDVAERADGFDEGKESAINFLAHQSRRS